MNAFLKRLPIVLLFLIFQVVLMLLPGVVVLAAISGFGSFISRFFGEIVFLFGPAVVLLIIVARQPRWRRWETRVDEGKRPTWKELESWSRAR